MESPNINVRTPRVLFPATIALLIANGLVFLGQLLAASRSSFPVDDYFALSLDGLRHGYFWQLLTYQFMHGGFWHIALNSLGIWVFGRPVEITAGPRRMVTLYFLSGIAGGIVQMLGTWLLPGLFGNDMVVGASAGVFGLIAAFAVLYPHQQLYLLLFFVIPLKLRAKVLLRLFVVISIIGIMLPLVSNLIPLNSLVEDLLGGNVAHAAHLGGIIFGYCMARSWLRRFRPAPPVIASPNAAYHFTPVE